ncbi:DUF106 domain-containing protein [Candidatus Woesearchaeota archaeon]|nr:DUF106 domain-containing protein [Candidatus Woesearchaeota archaeon]
MTPDPMLFGLPAWAFILMISAVLSLVVTLVYKFATDQAVMKELKEQIKKYQQQMKEHKDNLQKMNEIQKKSMKLNMKLMKQNFKPMLITMVPFIIIFWWLRGIYEGVVVIPLSFHFPLSGLETGLGWIGFYIICSMIFTTVFRKALKVV